MQLGRIDSLIIPKTTGKAFIVKKGRVLRVIAIDGPQVADMNAFNLKNPREFFSSSFTRAMCGPHLTTGHQLWSNPPRMRPMFTIIADTVTHKPSRRGAISHDLLFGRCNRRIHEWRYGRDKKARNCQDNLAQAIKKFGMGQADVHDPFNIFMRTGLSRDDRLFFEDSAAEKGDYIDLRAEMDCIVAISACPGKSSGPVLRPLGIEIYGALPKTRKKK